MDVKNFESALDYCNGGKLREKSNIAFLEDVKQYAFVTLRFKEQGKAFVTEMEKAGFAIPKPLRITGDLSAKKPFSSLVLWISPDEYLLIVKEDKKLDSLSILQTIFKKHSAFFVDTSGTYSFLTLGGEKALNILKKSTTYNIEALETGKVVSTNLGQSSAHLFTFDKKTYNLLVRFSFVAYVYELLERHAQEYLG